MRSTADKQYLVTRLCGGVSNDHKDSAGLAQNDPFMTGKGQEAKELKIQET